MPTITNVLIVGHDPRLLETRQWILQAAGFAVTATVSVEEAKQLLDSQAPMVLILCQTLDPAECEALLKIAHAGTQVTTLLMEGSEPMIALDKKDRVLERHLGPKELVAVITRLASLAQSGGAALANNA